MNTLSVSVERIVSVGEDDPIEGAIFEEVCNTVLIDTKDPNLGTPNPPLPTRLTFDYHFLDQSYFIARMVMMSIASAITLGSFIWVAQPEFLYLLCFGSAMVAASLAFVSFDESFGYWEHTLSAFCMTFPSIFVFGLSFNIALRSGRYSTHLSLRLLRTITLLPAAQILSFPSI